MLSLLMMLRNADLCDRIPIIFTRNFRNLVLMLQHSCMLQGYHILAMALFTPALLLEPQLLSISLAIAAALLVVVEVLRVGNVPILGPKIHRFMTSFIDSRDAGALLVSHFSLLAGASLASMSFHWSLLLRY